VSVELVVRNGTILDGSGGAPFAADVAIEGGRIAAVETLAAVDCAEIDASGLFVAPGFIDIHSHSDYTLLVDPRAMSAIHQGVTLEVVGNCGFGCFPIRDAELARKAIYGYSDEVPIDWRTAAGYFERLEASRPAVNVLSLVPNGQLRLSTVGLADRRADPGELAGMTRLLEESLAEGAFGYSTGLEYAQEAGAPEEEVAALCATRARPTRWPRRSASRAEAACGSRSPIWFPATGSRRRGARSGSSRTRTRAGSTSSSTCTPAPSASPTSTPPCLPGCSPRTRRGSRRSCATRPPGSGCGRTAAS